MFRGRLFDGRVSQGAEVVVSAVDGGLRLEPAEGTPVFWAWSELPRSCLRETGSTVFVVNGRQTLEVQDPRFLPHLKQAFPRAELFRSPFHSWIATPWRYSLTLAVAVALLAFAFLVVVPWGGDLVAASLPSEVERAAGLQFKAQLLAAEPEKKLSSARMQEFLNELKLPTKLPLTVTVLDTPTVNAFALMGGEIFVYRGLLELCRSPDELAGVLAHEAAHSELHHSARLIGRSLAGAFLLSYVLGDPSGITGAILSNVESLRSLQFSREMEAQADAWSVTALEGKTDSRALGHLLSRMEKVKLPAWATFLTDHPGTAERSDLLEKTGTAATASPELEKLFLALKTSL